MEERTVNDGIQHGIDNDPNNDAEKGAITGGIGGAVTGAVAGAMAGPVGAIIGAVVGGVAGAGLSGPAVAAIDRIDNDNTVTGLGHGVTPQADLTGGHVARDLSADAANAHQNVSNAAYHDEAKVENTLGMNGLPGTQTGGHAVDGTPDTRGITEKIADTVTGDHIDDKTGKAV